MNPSNYHPTHVGFSFSHCRGHLNSLILPQTSHDGRIYRFGDRVTPNKASKRPLTQASLRCKRWLNAAAQPCLEAGARDERTLEAVRCRPLILIEAPSSTYHHGMLVVGKIPKKRRRPHAILYEATPILLRYRSACSHHVRLYPESGRCDCAAPEYARWTRTLSQGHRALSGGPRR